jgi:hypothetical protein
MSGRHRSLGAFFVAAMLVGGCNSDGGPKTTSSGAAVPATEPATGGPACTVATAALVSEKLGFTLQGPNVDRGPAATVCTYDNPSMPLQAATIQVQTQATSEGFAKGRDGFATHGEPVTAVAGLGDEAYSASLTVTSTTNTTLVARRGPIEVLITTTAPSDRIPALMTAILALV